MDGDMVVFAVAESRSSTTTYPSSARPRSSPCRCRPSWSQPSLQPCVTPIFLASYATSCGASADTWRRSRASPRAVCFFAADLSRFPSSLSP